MAERSRQGGYRRGPTTEANMAMGVVGRTPYGARPNWRILVSIGRLELRLARGSPQCVHRQLSGFPVGGKPESVGQQSLHHLARLSARSVGRHSALNREAAGGVRVTATGVAPFRQTFERLRSCEVVCIKDQALQTDALRVKPPG